MFLLIDHDMWTTFHCDTLFILLSVPNGFVSTHSCGHRSGSSSVCITLFTTKFLEASLKPIGQATMAKQFKNWMLLLNMLWKLVHLLTPQSMYSDLWSVGWYCHKMSVCYCRCGLLLSKGKCVSLSVKCHHWQECSKVQREVPNPYACKGSCLWCFCSIVYEVGLQTGSAANRTYYSIIFVLWQQQTVQVIFCTVSHLLELSIF